MFTSLLYHIVYGDIYLLHFSCIVELALTQPIYFQKILIAHLELIHMKENLLPNEKIPVFIL